MSNRSSISSSNPIKTVQEPVKVALVTLVILICAGLALSISRDSFEIKAHRSNLTPVFSYLELNNPYDSKVIFLGSSRFVSCIKTDLFAKLSGIEEGKAHNLATDGSGFWEGLLICRKYPSILDSSPLVIVEVEPWMFNKKMIHPIYKKLHPFEPHFYTWATLQERLEFPDLETKLILLADYVWPISERRSLRGWRSLISSIINGKHSEPRLSIPLYHYQMNAYQALADDPTFFARKIVNNHLNNFEFAGHKAEYLKRLIQLAEKKSKNIVLLQPPVRKEYIDVIYDNPKYLATYMQVIRFIHSLEKENVRSIIWETPEDCGLNDSVFIDYGHFNLNGAYAFTQKLFNELKGMGLVGSNTTSESASEAALKDDIGRLEEYVKTNPRDHEALYKLGNLYFKIDSNRAMGLYRSAVSIRPDYTNAMEKLAMLYSNAGKYDDAMQMLTRMKELRPGNADVYYNIACIEAKQNRLSESIESLKTAMDKGFNNRHLLVIDKDLDNIKTAHEFKELLVRTQKK